MLFEDTIAAVGTAPGEGGIGIIRISGPLAPEIAHQAFRSPGGASPELESHTVRYGFIADPDTGERLDEVLLIYMAAPRSYTREHVVEVHCHGGPMPVRRVLALVNRLGARLAEPGEFTRRAFLSGRLDLTQAEAALDIIRARTEQAEKMAMEQLGGAISLKVGSIREGLIEARAHMEAYLDFPEDEIEPAGLKQIAGAIKDAAGLVHGLARSFEQGRLYREGVRTALVGRPNVGKSSLLNMLLERDRAIVTSAPGTTRDVIEESVNVHGIPFVIMDTAGIRASSDMVESEGVRRSLEALKGADLVLGVFDSSEPLHQEDSSVLEHLRAKRALIVLNKADLPERAGAVEASHPVVRVSARTGKGLEGLLEAMRDAALEGAKGGPEAEGVVVTNMRHRDALLKAGEALGRCLVSLETAPLEISAMELREATDALGEIMGAVSTEEILERIFSSFCIGK